MVTMGKQQVRTLHHCSYRISYHLVLVTKCRHPVITAEMLIRAEDLCRRTLRFWEGELLEFNGTKDHIHLLLSLTPKTSPSRFVNNLKTVLSRVIRKEFKEDVSRFYRKPVFWSRSYFIATCGGAPLSVIKQYIESQ